ncbi:hypothetical protein DOY81_008793, partial [Sarcophaga bullata]
AFVFLFFPPIIILTTLLVSLSRPFYFCLFPLVCLFFSLFRFFFLVLSLVHCTFQGGYLDGLRSHLGGLTQRVKSWYWGRPLELATKLSRSFDMKEEGGTLLGDKGARRHQSMQRLSAEQQQQNGSTTEQTTHEHNPNVVPDHRGNLHVTVKKTKPILEENGAAFEAGGLEVGQLILEVDGTKVEGLHHQEVARLIAECFANREKADITFLVVEAKKSNLEPKPTALIFLEA